MVLSAKQSRVLWWLIFLSCLGPLLFILWEAFAGRLGAEPAKALVDFLGQTAIIVLMLTLAVTPLKSVSFLPSFLRYRRMLGLWAFFYAFVHVLSYGLFLVDWNNFVEDLYKRPYISMGALAFTIMFALAVTSPKAVVRSMGKRWKSLHRWVYLALIAAVVHFAWQVRSDYTEAIIYIGVAVMLLSFRVPYFIKKLPILTAK